MIIMGILGLFLICQKKTDMIIIIFSVIIIVLGTIIQFTEEKIIYKSIPEVKIEHTSVRDSVEVFMKFLNMKHTDIAMAQFIIESNNFKSKLFKVIFVS